MPSIKARRISVIAVKNALESGKLKCFAADVLSSEPMVKKCPLFNCKNTIIATSTISYLQGNEKIDKSWQKIIDKRNLALKEIAEEFKYTFNDLYSVSVSIPKEERTPEGVHYTKNGYDYFARQVAQKIKENIK